MKKHEILDRLKSPVLWGVILTELYAQLELWRAPDTDAKSIIIGILMIVVTAFGALNDPTNRDAI